MTEPVVVSHGLWLPGAETKLLRVRLKNAGFAPQLFRFATVRASLADNADRLARLCEQIGGETLHFVGYSLGGVVTLTMLQQQDWRRSGRIVCLGAPLTGSRAAARLARSKLGERIVGKSMNEHMARGGLASWDRDIELGIIAGTRSLGVGRFVASFSGANDGTVMVDETRLPGAKEHMTLPVTHTQMLFDARVARQTIHFLRYGRFGS